jgi:hypothetical protein
MKYSQSKVDSPNALKGAWEERRYSSYSFLNPALKGSVWSASRPGRLYPQERAPGTHCTGGWVGPKAGRAQMVEEKSPNSAGD